MVLTKEERSDVNWEGVMGWWGVPDSDGTHRPPATNLSEEDEEWVLTLVKKKKEWLSTQSREDVVDPVERVHQIADPVERVHQIAFYFYHTTDTTKYNTYNDEEEVDNDDEVVDSAFESLTSAEWEALLDELQGFVKSIDVVQELHLIDAVVPLLFNVMYNKHAPVRAKVAEVVSTLVHNDPSAQQLMMEVEALHPLLYNFNYDPDVTVRTKALGAISSLIRNNKPGITKFLLENGYEAVRGALSSESVSFQREALNLIQYLLRENSPDCNIVTELGLHHNMMQLTSGDDVEVREAALRCLLVLARYEGGKSVQLVKNDDKLKQVLQERIERISAMAPEDLGATREERQLVESLWNACYNEPSSLLSKSLLVLPGEDAPAPHVASKLFERPPRAWAAAEVTDGTLDMRPSELFQSWKRHCSEAPMRLDPPSPSSIESS